MSTSVVNGFRESEDHAGKFVVLPGFGLTPSCKKKKKIQHSPTLKPHMHLFSKYHTHGNGVIFPLSGPVSWQVSSTGEPSTKADGKILIRNMFFPFFKLPLLTDDDNFQVNCFPRFYFRTCPTSPRLWPLTSSCQVLIPQGLPNVHCLVVLDSLLTQL